MRVALITLSLPPSPSGLARAAHTIANALAKEKCDVVVFTADRRHELRTESSYGVVGIAPRLGSWLAAAWRVPVLGAVAVAVTMRRAVAREHRCCPFDMIEAHNWKFPGIALHPLAPFVTRNSTSILSMGDIAPARSMSNRLELLGIRILFSLERWSAVHSSAMISNTHAHKETIRVQYRLAESDDPFHGVAYLCLDDDFLYRLQRTAPRRNSIMSLLFVGRNTRRKGFDALMAAFEQLERLADYGLAPDFTLTLVGVEGLANLSPRLRQAGWVDDTSLHRLYGQADIVIAPSRYESFGLVYLEGMSYGKPVVACAESCAALEIVGMTESGILVERCDGAEIAEGILALLCSADLRRQLGENGRTAAAKFDSASLARATLSIYRRAIARERQCPAS